MERSEERKKDILHAMSCLPRNILSLHGRDNAIEFVLHELCKDQCFNLSHAAYVVDNPDFDCMKGIAGYDREQAYQPRTDIWHERDQFSDHMKKSSFNAKVRELCKCSLKKKGKSDKEIVEEIAHDLGFKKPRYYAWDMKYDNRGLLLYEKFDTQDCDCDYLLDGLCFLGFCPVF